MRWPCRNPVFFEYPIDCDRAWSLYYGIMHVSLLLILVNDIARALGIRVLAPVAVI